MNTIKINGKIICQFNGTMNNVVVNNGGLSINGIKIDDFKDIESRDIRVEVSGDVGSLECGGSVLVKGNCLKDIDCGGSVTVEGKVVGDINAGGSVKICNNKGAKNE